MLADYQRFNVAEVQYFYERHDLSRTNPLHCRVGDRNTQPI